MITSASLLSNVLNKYKKTSREYFENPPSTPEEEQKKSVETKLAYSTVIVSLVFLVVEFILLFSAVSIALHCGDSMIEKAVHLVFAVFFTFPYTFIMILFIPCAKKALETKKALSTSCGCMM